MSNCVNCGAPLPPAATRCNYCRTAVDVDLKGLHYNTVHVPSSPRSCPRCCRPLQTINLSAQSQFLIERCEQCLGLFFDPGELQALLDGSAATVFQVDFAALNSLKGQLRHDAYPVGYIKCPVCSTLMNRVNFGAGSGVIVDTCKGHGLWLDAGELRQLMAWAKAGGTIVKQQQDAERKRKETLAAEKRRAQAMPVYSQNGGSGWFDSHTELDLMKLLVRFVMKLL
jgi:Zn-finger nucleic acid-binding protein